MLLLGVKYKMDTFDMQFKMQKLAIADAIEVECGTLVATATAFFGSTVPTGTKRRILSVTVNNASKTTPYVVTLKKENAAGTLKTVWSKRPLQGNGFVQDNSDDPFVPLFSIESGGNLQFSGDTGFDGYAEVRYIDDHPDMK